MCEKCGQNLQIIIHCQPIEVTFPIKRNKSAGPLKRSGDISGIVVLDMNTITPNKCAGYWATCECGSEVSLDQLFNPPDQGCAICGNKETKTCQYNELQICDTCYLKHVNYCSVCPFKNGCALYKAGHND